jgi:molybdate transport system substrate-binding protein
MIGSSVIDGGVVGAPLQGHIQQVAAKTGSTTMKIASTGNSKVAHECVTVGGGATIVKVAMASNLWIMFKDEDGLAERFLDSTYNPNNAYKLYGCHGATGDWVTELTDGGNPENFSVFLAANVAGPNTVCGYANSTTPCLPTSTLLPNNPVNYTRGLSLMWTAVNSTNKWDDNGTINVSGVSNVNIADPGKAPYGVAAIQILNSTKQYDNVSSEIVYQDNIDDTLKATQNDNSSIGFIAKSQQCVNGTVSSGAWHQFPDTAYDPIIQGGAVLNVSSSVINQGSINFMGFVNSDEDDYGQDTFAKYCYASPDI